MKKKGKCRPHPNKYYHCGDCCAEVKCTDKECPWQLVCKGENYLECEDYIKPTEKSEVHNDSRMES